MLRPPTVMLLSAALSSAVMIANVTTASGAPTAARPVGRLSIAGQPGATLHWKPFFLTLKHRAKTVRLFYAPASLEFEIADDCQPSAVQFTLTGSGQIGKQEYNEYTLKALTRDANVCDIYATAPHAQIRSTLQVTTAPVPPSVGKFRR
jgi:hypothetical protein